MKTESPKIKMFSNQYIVGLIGGTVLGAILVVVAVWKLMPGMMITTHVSKYATVEETAKELKAAIEAEGWQCPAIRNMNAAMKKSGVEFDKPIRIVELCKAEYAREVLDEKPKMLTLMPCAFGVYKAPDGKVHISGMNTGLMGKMFGGVIARVMGNQVANDEARILKRIVL